MPNELVFFATIIVELFFLLYMLRLGKQGLAAVVVVNIILVSCFGGLLIPLFGFTTNAGNVFYATIFLAAQMMVERYGRDVAARSVWIGFSALVLFVLMAQYSIRLVGVADSSMLLSSIHDVFSAVPRIALASMGAYLISQHLNIWLFAYLRKRQDRPQLWLRSLLSSITGQIVDSILFFTIAFAGTMSFAGLTQTIFVGFCIKVFVAAVGVPALYMGAVIARTASHDRRSGEF